jgi:hypothetical protein
MWLDQLALLGSMEEVQRVGIEATGIGQVGQRHVTSSGVSSEPPRRCFPVPLDKISGGIEIHRASGDALAALRIGRHGMAWPRRESHIGGYSVWLGSQ